MILSVGRCPPATPETLARATVLGGLVYVRPGLSTPVSLEYTRHLPEMRPATRRLRRRRRRLRRRLQARRARRLVPLEPTPLLSPDTFPTRWQRLFGTFRPTGRGVANSAVYHRGHFLFGKWSVPFRRVRRVFKPGLPVWHPRRQQHPLVHLLGWKHLVRGSFLGGLRRRPTRDLHLYRRFCKLCRRLRRFNHNAVRVARLADYRRVSFRKKKAKPLVGALRRHRLSRRRRLRGYLVRRGSLQSHLRGTTRAHFQKSQRASSARAELARTVTPAGYYESVSRWVTHLFGQRVWTGLFYNYYDPDKGQVRFERRRRIGARPWKLGQHPRWGVPFHRSREMRWAWFSTTLVGQLRASPEGDPAVPPIRPGLAAATYWSVQKWGRSRWRTRPTARAARVFVQAVKSGLSVEHDASQWGQVSTSATGVLLSTVAVQELKPRREPEEVVDEPPRARPPRQRVRLWLRLVGNLTLTLGWRVFSLFWRGYSFWARVWCFLFFGVTRTAAPVAALYRAAGAFVYTLVFRQLYRPFRREVTHWVKERRLVRTMAWVWSAWLLVYSSENDQDELEVPHVFDPEDTNVFEEEFSVTNEHEHDFDPMADGTHTHRRSPNPFEAQWLYDTDGFYHDTVEQLEELADEVAHRAGLLVRPLIDLVVRWPGWAVAEWVSLTGLTAKLEFQRAWFELLRRGNLPDGRVRGRWWKFPLLIIRFGLRLLGVALVFYVVFTQLDYSALRLGITYNLGLPWREEYYAAWCGLCLIGAVAVAGPPSWRTYLFDELGTDNLVGLFVAGAQVADPEDYYPHRPVGFLERQAHRMMGGLPKWNNFLSSKLDSTVWVSHQNLSSYDPVRLVLAQYGGWASSNFDEESDFEVFWFLFPIHLSLGNERDNYWIDCDGEWIPDLTRLAGTDRASRHPYGERNNYYDLDFVNKLFDPYTVPCRDPASTLRNRFVHTELEEESSSHLQDVTSL